MVNRLAARYDRVNNLRYVVNRIYRTWRVEMYPVPHHVGDTPSPFIVDVDSVQLREHWDIDVHIIGGVMPGLHHSGMTALILHEGHTTMFLTEFGGHHSLFDEDTARLAFSDDTVDRWLTEEVK